VLKRLADELRRNGHRHVFSPRLLGHITSILENGHLIEV
jgi:hypothetical protein